MSTDLASKDISSEAAGLLFIGRADELDNTSRKRRAQLSQELRIRMHSYDWVSREAAVRLRELERQRRG
jgi:hypothetical protein